MPEIPQEALRAGTEALEHESEILSQETCALLANLVLRAAAPVLAEHIAQKILAHMEARSSGSQPSSAFHAYRMHFGTAARIAARAFMTEDEVERAVAGALARGDYTGCPAPEDSP